MNYTEYDENDYERPILDDDFDELDDESTYEITAQAKSILGGLL